MNTQPIEKRSWLGSGSLDVHGIFGPTFQGEGPFVGMRCIFVRLAGCNLQCPGCDTIYTGEQRRFMTPEEIRDEIDFKVRNYVGTTKMLVVVSGGEPFRQNLAPLFQILTVQAGYFVQVETNGTLEPAEYLKGHSWAYNIDTAQQDGVYVVCSPKTGKVATRIPGIACAYKYVGAYGKLSSQDGLPMSVLDHTAPAWGVARPPMDWTKPIYLNPMDHSEDPMVPGETFAQLAHDERTSKKNKLSLSAVKQSCLKHGYILGVQLHKIIGVE